MKTYSFIGSDKNAGKTTAFNYVYRNLYTEGNSPSICLTSIGINGEEVDSFEGGKKPQIEILPGIFFVTKASRLTDHTGKYITLQTFTPPLFNDYILGKALLKMDMILEGPNSGDEILVIKQSLSPLLGQDSLLLIDGSMDRQFLAQPEISDGFYFSLLFTKRAEQMQKRLDFLKMLSLPPCTEEIKEQITHRLEENTKSLLITESGKLIHRGSSIVSRDRELRTKCAPIGKGSDQRYVLYLRGAMTRSFHTFLASFRGLQVVLDNFSLFLNISTSEKRGIHFHPKISLFNPRKIKTIFISQETDIDYSLLPKGVVVRNLFRGTRYES